jgi:YidC/Oxa1 family membrane protein insertase
MQDQGKRLLFAVALMLGVLLLWQKLFPPADQPKDGQGSAAGSAGSAFVVPNNANKPTSPVGFSEQLAAAPGTTIDLKFPKFTATFSSTDGTLSGWHLADSRYDKDATHGELIPAQGADFLVGFTKDSTFKLPKHAQWTGEKISDHQVTYKLSTPDLDVTKAFDVSPEAFEVRLTVTVQLHLAPGKEAHESLAITSFQLQDPKVDSSGSSRIQARVWMSSTMRNGSIVQTDVKDVIEHPRLETNVQWTGFEHPYLLVGFAPKPTGGAVDKHTYASDAGLIETDMVFQPTMFKAGDAPMSRELVAFLGPKNLYQLRDADAAAGFPTGFGATIDLGWFGFISKPLLWLLIQLHGIFGNWGLAIIMLTVIVKLLTLYWTTKSMRSMKEMALLGPKIKELQEKYKDDKQRQQTETWALYKENGVSPVAGCLPMFLQMPIWIALYRTLSTAGELYHQSFFPAWIPDLTATDPTHVLTFVLVAAMFAQARLTPQTVDPSQRSTQVMMQYGMPLMFGAMSWVFPSGLSLYMFTNTCLQALHSIYINKFDKKSMALAAQLRENQLAALAAKNAKNANPKGDAKPDAKPIEASSKPADDDAAPAIASKPAGARPGQGQKKKKGRR